MHAHCVVIEEDPDIRSLLSLALSRAGFKVTTESTGAAGVSTVAGDSDLELVTVDVALHDLQGNDVLHALRGVSQAPILVISARAEPVDRLTALESGASAYLTKPFRLRDLQDLVHTLAPAS
ncbi:response regulator [Arthrobacter oryzae]|uniref:response regulator transcription factor n=1 Tax=Arthrobacter oryzae TaxID=409290 RepID=UPI0028655E77|nr:response regulator [Arthrobacter oryzae]MDR6505076.1 DNA-binding response OmpR family regulator [Arthrobacter oryzae]